VAEQRGGVIPLGEAFRTWFLISWQTFGGPAGQIAVMHRELVEERRWIGERRFLHAMSYCMLLPGPEAQQLAIYSGWLLNGWFGGVMAGVLFVLPGFITILGLSWIYVAHGDSTVVTGVLVGLAAAVLPIVVQAVLRLGSRAIRNRVLLGLEVPERPVADDDEPPLIPDDALRSAPRSARRNLVVLVVGLLLWVAPVALAAGLAGGHRASSSTRASSSGGWRS
jgi:chromate transporter